MECCCAEVLPFRGAAVLAQIILLLEHRSTWVEAIHAHEVEDIQV